jgi:hypothetical protein
MPLAGEEVKDSPFHAAQAYAVRSYASASTIPANTAPLIQWLWLKAVKHPGRARLRIRV